MAIQPAFKRKKTRLTVSFKGKWNSPAKTKKEYIKACGQSDIYNINIRMIYALSFITHYEKI